MAIDEQTKSEIERLGPDWVPLLDALQDSDFREILSDQLKQFYDQAINNPRSIHGNRNYLSEILRSYLAWEIYKKTKLPSLKKSVSGLQKQVTDSASELKTIRESARYISGATTLVEYSKTFSERAKEHGTLAKEQQKYYFISLAGFGLVVALVFFFNIAEVPFFANLIADDVKSLPLNTGILAIKIFLLIFVYQVTQFFRKNYGAEKNLQELYQHRSDVLQSLHAVYEALKDSPEERSKILSAGALFAYERGETGYITTKEGAGSAGDGLIESVLSSVIKR